MSNQDHDPTAAEKRARELFEASVDSLDERTRVRLAAARREAVDAVTRSERQAWRTWAPVAAAASAALVAALLWRIPAPQAPATQDPVASDATLDSVELLASGEDVDLVENDLAFYDWVDAADFDSRSERGLMSRLIARIASSALLAVPVVARAGDAPQTARSTVGPAAHGTAAAPAADQEFLEYLGSWDGSDEDWVVAGEPVRKKARATGVEKGGPASSSPASGTAAGRSAAKPDASGNTEQQEFGQEQGR